MPDEIGEDREDPGKTMTSEEEIQMEIELQWGMYQTTQG